MLIQGAAAGHARRRLTAFVSFALALFSLNCSPDRTPSTGLGPTSGAGGAGGGVGGWTQDLDFLATELPKRHKDLFFALTAEQFAAEVAELRAAIAELADDQVILAMAKIVAMVGDAHTSLRLSQPATGFHYYPLSTYWFSDGLFVVRTTAEHAATLGARVTHIGETAADDARGAASTVIAHENDAQLDNQSPVVFQLAEVLHFLGLADTKAVGNYQLEGKDGPSSVALSPVPLSQSVAWQAAPDPNEVPPPLYLSNLTSNYWYQDLSESKTLYLQYNRCQEMASLPFADFATDVLSFADASKPSRVVIDLRLNGGGNSTITSPLISGLAERPAINDKGHLFVIIGRSTFSSAVLNALQLMNNTAAIFVGEPSGGRPNHYGEVKQFALPFSGLQVSYSTKYFSYLQGEDPVSLVPDVLVQLSSADYFSGKDPVLDAVLEYPQ